MLLMCPEWLPDNTEEIVKDEALEFSMSMWGMATDKLAPPRRDPANLQMRVALEEATGSDIGTINADAYEMPPELFSVTGNMYRWSGENFGIVGYDHGKAVSSALTYPLDDEIYVAMVATRRGLHGGGYAETVMRRAIEEAQKKCGDGRLWLHATEAGRPLYTSMGFTLGSEMRLYSFA